MDFIIFFVGGLLQFVYLVPACSMHFLNPLFEFRVLLVFGVGLDALQLFLVKGEYFVGQSLDYPCEVHGLSKSFGMIDPSVVVSAAHEGEVHAVLLELGEAAGVNGKTGYQVLEFQGLVAYGTVIGLES